MTRMHLVGAGAGLASGLLVASLSPDSVIGLFLFYLAPLPLFLAGLGWSPFAAAVGAVVGSIVVGAAIMPLAGLVYAIVCGGPVAWLSHLAMLSRSGEDGTQEWYPAGRLLLRAGWLACGFILAGVVVLGPGWETFHANTYPAIEAFLKNWFEQGLGDANEAAELASQFAPMLPSGMASSWLLLMCANLWVGGRIIRTSGRLARPWPNLHRLTIPPLHSAVFGACFAASLMPGTLGFLGGAASQVWIIVYLFIGLSVLHAVTVGVGARIAILTLAYFLISLGIAALVIVLVGVAETVFNIRAWLLARRGIGPD